MTERWYEKAIIYCLDVETFQDSDGDGVGDFAGLTRRLDYLTRLGVDCLWLNPIHPSPGRDGGYEVADYYNVHPRLGTLGDFAAFLQAAESRGIRVILDLVVNHTSDEHPWFQSARSSPDSPYRDWYVWSDREPTDRRQGMVFPGEQEETWTYDETAGAWYYHRFYRFQPDLNISNPRVRDEIKKIASFWLQLGAAGFRMDAVPFLIESTNPDGSIGDKDFGFLTELRQHVQWQRRDALLLAEANVDPDRLTTYFGDSGGSANRLHMLFDFLLNGQIMLALARRDPEPVIEALRETPVLPRGHSGPRSCATTTRSTCRGSPPTSGRRCSPSSVRRRTCACTGGGSAVGSRRCLAATSAASGWRTRFSSPCAAHRSSATAKRSAWATTCRCRTGRRSVRRCSGHRCPTPASPPPHPTGWPSRWSPTAHSATARST
jgi:hypothetical protein